MALIEKQIIDKIEVLENNTIQIRRADIIEKDGQEISRTFHRHVISPIDDISNENDKVKTIAKSVWTPEVIEQYKNDIEAKKNDLLK